MLQTLHKSRQPHGFSKGAVKKMCIYRNKLTSIKAKTHNAKVRIQLCGVFFNSLFYDLDTLCCDL